MSATAVVTAPPPCAWCGSPLRAEPRRLAVCPACASARTWPPPGPGELTAAYAGAYRPAAGRFGGPLDRVLAHSRGTLARRVDALAPPGPVLDVGSGDGALLAALAARGRTAVGLERGAAGGREDLRVPAGPAPVVRAVELVDFHERPGEWAAVVFWHSLEHLEDAPAALDRATALLAPGGLLIVAVPNHASWQARRLGDRWLALDLPRHLWHLSDRALIAAVQERGLDVERVSFWRGGQVLFGWLHGLVTLVPGRPSLYDAIRRPEARFAPMSGPVRTGVLLAGVLLAPVAAGLSALEVLARRGGTVYVQARRHA